MTLEELIQRLELEPDKTRVCAHGFDDFHSWRGDYGIVAFRPIATKWHGLWLADFAIS